MKILQILTILSWIFISIMSSFPFTHSSLIIILATITIVISQFPLSRLRKGKKRKKFNLNHLFKKKFFFVLTIELDNKKILFFNGIIETGFQAKSRLDLFNQIIDELFEGAKIEPTKRYIVKYFYLERDRL